MTVKPNPKPADLGPLKYYTENPDSKTGEFAHAGAVIADLNADSFSESRGPGAGAFALAAGKSQKPSTGKANPTSTNLYNNAAGSKPPSR